MPRAWIPYTLTAIVSLVGCRAAQTPQTAGPALSETLDPGALFLAIQKADGGRYRSTTVFEIKRADDPSPGSRITTITQVDIDAQGQFQIIESNDHGGGRMIHKVGKDLTIALEPEKHAIRRPAQSPEPERLVQEALGGPASALDLLGRFAQISKNAPDPKGIAITTLTRAATPTPLAASGADEGPAKDTTLGAYRATMQVSQLSGSIQLSKQHLPLAFSLEGSFGFVRDGANFQGNIHVTSQIEDLAAVQPITAPEAEPLRFRQRTILEERALLDGLNVAGSGGARPTPTAPKP